ncbi:short chain dehydrogenase reductase [Phaeosphaeriaceae sp. PMI808]|nr:short chain dehydrogenase reductase [Phaeosphaeriaceae sp. PMI808]
MLVAYRSKAKSLLSLVHRKCRAEAILLAEGGAYVLCVDLNLEWAQRTVELVKEGGKGSAIAFKADVSKEEECKKIVQAAIDNWGRLDILVNNVGVGVKDANCVDIDMLEWDRGMRINFTSVIMVVKYAVPEMRKNEGLIRGSIINLLSIAGLGGGMRRISYPATKGAIVNITKNLAFQYGKEGIRVNCVAPGSPWTLMLSEHPDIMNKIREVRANNNILGLEGYGWDTGYAVRWLAGLEARWVTGVILLVDGGLAATDRDSNKIISIANNFKGIK